MFHFLDWFFIYFVCKDSDYIFNHQRFLYNFAKSSEISVFCIKSNDFIFSLF